MKATPDAQKRLLEIQAVDTTIDQLKHRRDSLPEHEEISKILAFRRQVREALVASATEISDLESECAKAEADLVPVRERKERNQGRIDTGQVPDAKVLSALIDEVAHLGRRIGELEDEQLEAMERLETAQARHSRLLDKEKEMTAMHSDVVARRDQQVGEIDQDIAARMRQRADFATDVSVELVALYDRIRAKFGGTGAAKLLGSRCSGCQLEATASDLDRYRAAPLDEVLRCEECDRILIR